MFERINAFLQNCNSADLPGGAIITGGGSLLKGMNEAAEQLLELKQARCGFARPDLIECPEEYLNQTYTSAIGLVCYPCLKSWVSDTSAPRRPVVIPASGGRWVKDIF